MRPLRSLSSICSLLALLDGACARRNVLCSSGERRTESYASLGEPFDLEIGGRCDRAVVSFHVRRQTDISIQLFGGGGAAPPDFWFAARGSDLPLDDRESSIGRSPKRLVIPNVPPGEYAVIVKISDASPLVPITLLVADAVKR